MKSYTIEKSAISYFFTADTRSAPLWLIVRVYLGYEWVTAGWGKLHNPAWVGEGAGSAVQGFVQGALEKTSGAHPDVQAWYAYFLEHVVLPNAKLWAFMVSWGELAVGLALIIGFLVGLSALFGVFMNYNFLLAGTVSVNPIMIALGILLILAWRVAGHIGADRYVLPMLHRHFRPRMHGG